MKHKWTEEEIEFLKEKVDSNSNRELAILLNVPKESISNALFRNKIKRKEIKYKTKEITYIINGDCHECTSHHISAFGYPKKAGRNIARYIYEQYYNITIPKGIVVRHTCDNRICINPLHLIIGTQADNVKDKVERNRVPKGSQIKNSKLNEKQVIKIKNKIKKGITTKQLAKEYNVSYKAIAKIKRGITWKHVK